MTTPEEKARVNIDRQLVAAGWEVVDRDEINPSAPAQAIREVPMKPGHGQVDYLLYVEGKAIGVLEAKKEGEALSTHEMQPEAYSEGLPEQYPAWRRPLPFQYLSTGEETFFRNNLDPQPRSRRVFAFHKPGTLRDWAEGKVLLSDPDSIAEEPAAYGKKTPTLLSRIQHMPSINIEGMWSKQVTAIENLEKSLRENRRKALVQMATGSGKTFTAITECYRLIKYAGAKRILFLVDRKNLGDQAEQEFHRYTAPDTNRKFTELYTVQHLKSNTITQSSRVCIATIQRVFSILKGEEEMPEDADERSAFERQAAGESLSVVYNPQIPPETFDFVIVDECHRSIYNLWSQVLEYFDASLIGLTATPSKHTIGYFDGNQVMYYTHEEAVADGVNVDFSVYRIRTKVTEQGAVLDKNEWVKVRDRRTRKERQAQLDEELIYDTKDLDRSVVNPSQVRTVIEAFRDKLFTEIYPGRTEVPKTLIFAKDDDHAELIVRTVRETFAKGDEFCRKITYRAGMHKLEDGSYKRTNVKVDDIIKAFTNSFMPRVAVTVDMIATGTDTKPVEIVFFMRDVKSENYFEQMKGRGVRVMG
ncbi:MAG: DEAD/DEAH box helicase family protein, partial [Chrysiogenetes bacterium]|nr:DEAD/DEAH box helicase family protein [Chrysiogenetes bacterium]